MFKTFSEDNGKRVNVLLRIFKSFQQIIIQNAKQLRKRVKAELIFIFVLENLEEDDILKETWSFCKQ
jgi:hypothetical protein